jgi:hypothetical protein
MMELFEFRSIDFGIVVDEHAERNVHRVH